MANISDVARLAGVSTQTVSRVLNNEDVVRPATRERVERAIAELNYRPSLLARALVTRRSRTVGLISTGNPLYGPSSTALAFNEAARQAGYQVTIASMAGVDRESMLAAIDVLLRQNVEALVLIAADVAAVDAIAGLELGVPLVTAESSGRAGLHGVSIDQHRGALLATAHLADLGHRTIAHVAGPPGSMDAAERERGWREELGRRGLEPGPLLVGDWSPASGHAQGLLLPGGVTAVVSGNDQMALGLLRAFGERGIRVPGQVSLVGFDDIPEAAYFAPPLTTVRQDFAALGRDIMARVLDVLAGRDAAGHARTAPELVVRESTAPPRG